MTSSTLSVGALRVTRILFRVRRHPERGGPGIGPGMGGDADG